MNAQKTCSGYELQKECAYIALEYTMQNMAYNRSKPRSERNSDLKYLIHMSNIFEKEGDLLHLSKVKKIISTHP